MEWPNRSPLTLAIGLIMPASGSATPAGSSPRRATLWLKDCGVTIIMGAFGANAHDRDGSTGRPAPRT